MRESMTPEEALRWDDLIQKIARFVSSDFPDVERQDISQELWAWLMRQKNLVDPDRYGMAKIIRSRAVHIAWQFRKEQLRQTSQYSYRNSDVRELLETALDHDEWEGSFVPDDAKSGHHSRTMDAIDLRADVRWALETLSEAHQEAIIGRYRDKVDPEPGTPERKHLNRAIQRLTDRLNSYYHRRIGRRAISNATAQHIIERQEGI